MYVAIQLDWRVLCGTPSRFVDIQLHKVIFPRIYINKKVKETGLFTDFFSGSIKPLFRRYNYISKSRFVINHPKLWNIFTLNTLTRCKILSLYPLYVFPSVYTFYMTKTFIDELSETASPFVPTNDRIIWIYTVFLLSVDLACISHHPFYFMWFMLTAFQ